jgi:hypothetical protein
VWPGDPLLLVVIGSRHVEAGIWRHRSWQEGSICRIAIAEPGGRAALDQALTSLAEQYKVQYETLFRKQRGGSCKVRILLANTWIDGISLPWNPRAIMGSALTAHARGALAAAGISLEDGDIVRVEDGRYRQPRWAVVYPASLLQMLAQFVGKLDAVLESIAPLSIAAIHAIGKKPADCPVVALVDETELSLWYCPNGSSHHLLARSPLGGQGNDALEILWRRVCLRDSRLSNITRMLILELAGQRLDSSEEAQDHLRVNLPRLVADDATSPLLQVAGLCRDKVFELDAKQRYPRLGIRMAVAVCLWLGVAAWILFQALGTVGAEADAKGKLEAKARATAPKPAPVWSKADLQRIQAVNVAVRELNLPVSTLLQAIQPPKDIRVAILGVEFSPGRRSDDIPLLKLMAESRTGEEMARYTAFLAERRPLVDAYLVNHEVTEGDPLRPYRFSVEAKWRE